MPRFSNLRIRKVGKPCHQELAKLPKAIGNPSNVANATIAISNVPPEIIEEIIKHLPIDEHLILVGLASKFRLASLIFSDLLLACRHLDQQLQFIALESIFKDKASTTMIADWLPYNYRIHLVGKMLTSNSFYKHSRDLPPKETLRVLKALLSSKSFDPKSGIFSQTVCTSKDTLQLLLQDTRIDPSECGNLAIRYASGQDYTEIVCRLLADPRVNPSDCGNDAIQVSSRSGYAEVVRMLLTDPRVDPASDNNHAIREASCRGHAEVVRLLLTDPRVDPSVDGNLPIREASSRGHSLVVRWLLTDSRTDPSMYNNTAINQACRNGHVETIRVLLTDSRAVLDDVFIGYALADGCSDIIRIHLARADLIRIKSYYLMFAIEKDHTDVIELLLADSRFDLGADDNFLIRRAIMHGRVQLVRLILADSRMNLKFKSLLRAATFGFGFKCLPVLLAHHFKQMKNKGK
ncbi:UNVERIFIED_CONTAM: hypothetical protein HDU68_005841 [Siphonaria sp. JEL0065]|nr:hypothetical protein HDU68_005841 [Siphonaria sp. JEL0065]